MNYHQEALLNHSATQEIARICGMDPEDVLDIILPEWRGIKEWEYTESITWHQAMVLAGELADCRAQKGIKNAW